MASAEIHLTIMAAEELKSNKRLGKMSVYTVVWLDPAMKQSTRVLRKCGTNPVWNHEITFSLGENVLIYPHSTLTLEVSFSFLLFVSWHNCTNNRTSV